MIRLAKLPWDAGIPAIRGFAGETLAALADFRTGTAIASGRAAVRLCVRGRERARSRGDGAAANAAAVAEFYFESLVALASFWEHALEEKYKSAWDALIECENDIALVRRHAVDAEEHGLHELAEEVAMVQRLFPYRVFSSMELSYTALCSVCSLSPWDEACGHRVGELHMGRIVGVTVSNPKLIGLAITQYPKDKRMVMLPNGSDAHLDFGAVRDFVTFAPRVFMRLAVREERHEIDASEFAALTAADACPCESGRPFATCHRGAARVPVKRLLLTPDGGFEMRPLGSSRADLLER